MTDLPKNYEPQAVETKWYERWLEWRCFTPNPDSPKPAYAIVIPPPNVTGVLTLGHVLNNTIQDILARKARMEGKEVLWLPGTDHAGIATQAVVEKTLKKQGAIRHRDDLGREAFLARVWEWKEKHGGIIIQQLKKLGASCDWSRERFTMDPDYSRCVQQVFVDLYRKGLIYRGRRMVNWDPAARTALSDEEVIMTEQRGNLWHLQYPLLDEHGQPQPGAFVIVATTRPETMLGDEAVAVNPTDPRYQTLIGRRCLLPLQNRQIPVIADEWVDPKFGTGCVKVTPAHDPADYEMAQRHQLPLTVVIGPDGMMTPAAGEDFVGLDRMEAREAVIEQLEAQGLLLKVEPYTHNVGYSERSHVPIEPYLSDQWFLRYPSVDRSTAAVEQGAIRFYPERWVKTYTHWMRNLKDWCISRQLWWGHRIPVWYRKPASPGNHAEIGRESAAIHVDVEPPPDPENWEQDKDVLDTWFSSWLWPFATMGWPESTPTLRKFYPTTDLVTGPDIIFFWVARMIMAGYEYLDEKPFAAVYFTGIIRDKLGRKMSKSLGNSPDPLDLINQFGADALRFGIMRSAPLGQDVLYDELHVALGRNFCNKLWNACRFRQLQGGSPEAEVDPSLLTVDDKWLLLKLDRAIREISNAFAEYRFTEVTQTLHRFFWNEYCDWYVEASKAVFQGDDPARKTNTLAVIDFVLSHMLRLFHPFLPFITEELWHGLGYQLDLPQTQGGQTIMSAPWPKPLDEPFKTHYGLDESDERLVDARCALIGRGRNLRREFNIPANRKITFILRPSGAISPHDIEVLRLLLNADAVNLDPAYAPPQGTPSALSELGELFMPLAGLVDAGAERARLTKELARIQIEIDRVQAKLDNPAFVQKVPPAVLEDHQNRLADAQARQAQFQTALDALQ
jgi:valyl-tRNA synthetase